MEFSSLHANFLVNHGGGVFEDALFLIQEAQKRVYEEFGIWLECEIEVLEQGYFEVSSPLKKG
jgi:UDP-N-acetylmuramate dehydrogenase